MNGLADMANLVHMHKLDTLDLQANRVADGSVLEDIFMKMSLKVL